MVADAGKYKAEDDAQKEKIIAGNGLENYPFTIQSTIREHYMEIKLSAEDKQLVEDKVKEVLDYMVRP